MTTPDPSQAARLAAAALVTVLLTCTGCRAKTVDSAVTFTAVLKPTRGNTVRGTVNFSHTNDGVRVQAQLRGLDPGEHGFHIHEHGDCRAPDGSTAGGHFNPYDREHNSHDADRNGRHAGDLGNITADEDGNAYYDRVDSVLEMTGDASILSRAIIVHERADDGSTQPSGNAGKRVACGVIKFDT